MALLPPPHSPPPRNSSFPSLPHRRQRKGRGGGAGLPSVLRLHRVFRLNQEIFLLPKRKKKKKKKQKTTQRPPFLPAPLGQLRLDLWGFPGGWLRAGTLSGKSGGAPGQALRQARFGLISPSSPPPLQANHQRWPSPALEPGSPWAAGRRATQHPCPSLLSWALPSTSCCGDIGSPPQVCAIFSTPPGRRARPQAGRGEGPQGEPAPRPPAGSPQGTRAFSVLGEPLSASTAPHVPPPSASPSLALIRAPARPHHSHLGLAFSGRCRPPLRRHCPGPPLDRAAGPRGGGRGGRSASQLANLRGRRGSGWLWALGWWRPLHPLIYFSAVSVLEKSRGGVPQRPPCPHLSCTFFVMGFIFYFIILFFFLIYDDSTPPSSPHPPSPPQARLGGLGSWEGASPTSALLPHAQPVAPAQTKGSPLLLPCPVEQPGCSQGAWQGGHGLAPIGGGGRGRGGTQARWPLPT